MNEVRAAACADNQLAFPSDFHQHRRFFVNGNITAGRATIRLA